MIIHYYWKTIDSMWSYICPLSWHLLESNKIIPLFIPQDYTIVNSSRLYHCLFLKIIPLFIPQDYTIVYSSRLYHCLFLNNVFYFLFTYSNDLDWLVVNCFKSSSKYFLHYLTIIRNDGGMWQLVQQPLTVTGNV